MEFDRYEVMADHMFKEFEFCSTGPKGLIQKRIIYTHFRDDLYVISFGDITGKNQVDTNARTNNHDRDKILATIAYTISVFTEHYPFAKIIIIGETSARTRLYQAAIARFLPLYIRTHIIWGFHTEEWSIFQKNKNYEAFLISYRHNA
jgi:hypothetical protein